MEKFKICELVRELEKREAVQSIWIEPYKDFKIMQEDKIQDLEMKQGPVKILVISD